MAALPSPEIRDPGERFEGGFDRWDPNSRSGWSMLWHGGQRANYAQGEGRTVWVWEEQPRIWRRLDDAEASVVQRAHELSINRLRRFLLIIRLLESDSESEREAARSALRRIGQGIADDWKTGPVREGDRIETDWLDNSAAVYLAATVNCRYHLPERGRIPFDQRVFTELFRLAQKDFKEGRRLNPPHLRPDDLYLLRPVAASSAVGGKTRPEPMEDTPPDRQDEATKEAPTPPGPDRMAELRKEFLDAVERDDRREGVKRQRVRRVYVLAASLSLGLLIIKIIASFF